MTPSFVLAGAGPSRRGDTRVSLAWLLLLLPGAGAMHRMEISADGDILGPAVAPPRPARVTSPSVAGLAPPSKGLWLVSASAPQLRPSPAVQEVPELAAIAKGSKGNAGKGGASESTGKRDAGESNGEGAPSTSPTEAPPVLFRRVSTSVRCTIWLAVMNLLMYIFLAFTRNLDELSAKLQPSWYTDAFAAVSRSCIYLPLMSCLFISLRMHVLANTEGLEEPQGWAKICMIVATAGITTEILIMLILPFAIEQHELHRHSELSAASHCDVHPHFSKQDFKHWVLPIIANTGLKIALLATYGGSIGVVVGVFTYSTGTGSMPLSAWSSPSLMATAILTIVFMFAHFGIWCFGRFEVQGFQRLGTGVVGGVVRHSRDVQVFRKKRSLLHDFFIGACSVMKRAPMLTVIFAAARLRAMELDPWAGRPQLWARHCFCLASGALCLEAMVQAVIAVKGEEEIGYYGVHIYKSRWSLHVARHSLSVVFFFWAALAGVSIPMLEASGETEAGPLPPALHCVLILGGVFLVVQIAQSAAFIIKDIFGCRFKIMQDTVLAADVSVSFCPMASMLFIAARLRAVQITDHQGNPQVWAQDTMYICVFAIIIQALCCLLLPVFTGMSASTDEQGNAQYDLTPMVGAYAVTAIKYFALLCIGGGGTIIAASIFVISPETAHYITIGDKAEDGSHAHLLKSALVLLLAVLVSLLLSSAKVVGLAIKFAVESVSGKLLGANILVDKAVLSIFHGFVQVKGVVLMNPEDAQHHFLTPHMIKIDNGVLHLNMWELVWSLGRKFEFKVLELTGAHINVEKSSMFLNSNVGLLLKKMKAAGPPKPRETPSEETVCCGQSCFQMLPKRPPPPATLNPPKSSSSAEVIVHKIDVRDVSALLFHSATFGEKPFFSAHLSDITYADFQEKTKGKSLPAQDLILLIIRTLLLSVLKNAGFIKAMTNTLGTHIVTAERQLIDSLIEVEHAVEHAVEAALHPRTSQSHGENQEVESAPEEHQNAEVEGEEKASP